jgi:hypothetical protein
MNARVAVLKQLVSECSYPIDEAAIAEAIVARSIARRLVPDLMGRLTTAPRPQVRSFRPHRGARSFRLMRAQHRAPSRRVSVPVRTRVAA